MPSTDPASVCVFCRRNAVDPAWKPFCSERCRLRDLACWADESYRIAGAPAMDEGPAESDDTFTERSR
jgi:endogenous inhibitor of DNA gyrase (YacG/DUF329 family)